MAYEIINRLRVAEQFTILNQLNLKVETQRATEGKKHNVWQVSFDWKECRTIKFMEQKVNYIHANPCSNKWNLCSRPEEYYHSSARQYLTGEVAAYKVLGYNFMLDVKLVKGDC